MLLGGGERLQQEVRGLVQYVHDPPTILSTGTLAAVGYMDIRQHVKNIKNPNVALRTTCDVQASPCDRYFPNDHKHAQNILFSGLATQIITVCAPVHLN